MKTLPKRLAPTPSSFLAFVKDKAISAWQLKEFGDFQKKVPSRGAFWLIGVYEDGVLVNGVQLFRFNLRKGLFWIYGGRGPVNEIYLDELVLFLESLFISFIIQQCKNIYITD